MDQELDEVPDAFNNHQTTESIRRGILTEHEFSDIPMQSLAGKKLINWSLASQQQANLSSNSEQLPSIELDSIQESEVVVIEKPRDVKEEIDAVAQVLDKWDPMADDHFKEQRKLQEISPDKGNSLTIHFENLPSSLSKESFCNMLKRAGEPKNLYIARHKHKPANFANATFATHQEYDQAFEEFNNFTIEGNKIRLSPGKPIRVNFPKLSPYPPQMATNHQEHTPQMATNNQEHTPQMATNNQEHTPQMATNHQEHTPQMATSHQEHTPLNGGDEYPPLPPSPLVSPTHETNPNPALTNPNSTPSPSLFPPIPTQHARPQLHLLSSFRDNQPAPRFRMPPPTVYQPSPSPQDTPTSPPSTLQSPTGVTQHASDFPDLNSACNDGPLKIAEHSSDEGFEVSVDVDPRVLSSFATSLMGVASTGSPDELDGSPSASTPPTQAITPEVDNPTTEQPMKPVEPEPHTLQEPNESPTAVNGFSNGIDRMESAFSSEVNKANLAGRYMFTGINTLKEHHNDFPFMVTCIVDFMCVCGMVGYHDDLQQYNAMKAEMKEVCDKAKHSLSVSTLVLSTLYIYLDPQGDPFRAFLRDKGRGERCLELVDTGKYMYVGYESLYQIPIQLAAIPYLSVKLRLNAVRAKKTFQKHEVLDIANKFIKTSHVYTIKLCGEDRQGGIYADLFDSTSNVSINRKISEFIEPTNTQHSPGNSSRFQFPPQTPTQSQQETLYSQDIPSHEPQLDVSAINTLNIISPMRIYAVECHPEAQTKLETLQRDLNNQASLFPSVTSPEPGLFVTAYRVVLSSWCRAEIVHVLSDSLCAIFYIDHGCHEVIALDKLKLLTPVFMTLPKQALILSLDGIACISQSGEWDQHATDYIKTHCMNKKRCIKFGEKISDGYLVTLYEDDTCQVAINQKLIELGLCASTSYSPQQLPLSAPVTENSPCPTEARPSAAQPKKKKVPTATLR